MGPIATLFLFTIRQTLWSRKIWLSLLVLSGPSALLLLIRNLAQHSMQGVEPLWQMYHVMVQFFLVMGLIPLVCMIYGSARIGAEGAETPCVRLGLGADSGKAPEGCASEAAKPCVAPGGSFGESGICQHDIDAAFFAGA